MDQKKSGKIKSTIRPRTALKPATLLSPVPVALVSCCGLPSGSCAKPNLITIAWAGTICSDPPMVTISVRQSRYSHQQIKETGEFVINLVDADLLQAADYCGVRSGRDEDKFKSCALTAIPADGMECAPAVAESPLYLACKVHQVIELGSHDCFLAEIVAVNVVADLLDKKDRLRLDKADLVAYVHGEYRLLGKQVGFFGFSVAAPEVLARRLKKKPSRKKG
ncbi:MAG: flavin reductase family protein [Bacillota bacterium]|nr:flavin reductase family protein [Bacillota bacterium]